MTSSIFNNNKISSFRLLGMSGNSDSIEDVIIKDNDEIYNVNKYDKS